MLASILDKVTILTCLQIYLPFCKTIYSCCISLNYDANLFLLELSILDLRSIVLEKDIPERDLARPI